MKAVFIKLNSDAIILFIVFILANLRASIFIHLFPDTAALFGPAWIEIVLWLFSFLAILYSLTREGQVSDYLLAWRRNWLLALFVVLALFSVIWSVAPLTTIFRGLELLFATLVGMYIGIRYHPSQLMEFLFWFGAILLILSVALVFAAPKSGTMYWPPFNGAWRGVFWHRNHLSSITAFLSIVFLCRIFLALEKRNTTGFLDMIFYVLCLLVLFFTESATGYILFVSLNVLAASLWLWQKIYLRLQTWHYYSAFGVFGLGLVLVLSNLDIVFRLLNRDTTLTGRVGLWTYLVMKIVPQRLWWGHGFGAVWTLDSFREDVMRHAGWVSQPLIADNGFLDILLHLGLVGLAALLVVLIVLIVKSVQYAISNRNPEGFFPLLFVAYVLIANIPFSLIAETEVFMWMLIVIFLCMIGNPENLYVNPSSGDISTETR